MAISIKKARIPFYPNLKDNLHCFQSALKMVFAVFENKFYSYTYLDQITGYKKNNLTWDTTALLFLAENGYTVIKISTFDYPAFASEGTSYLKKFWRSDVYTTQAKFSNFQRERRIVTRLIKDKRIRLKIRKPTLALVSAYLQEGWLAIAHIDVSILDNTKNYSPHSIVITDVRPTRVSFHDPGLPPEENRSVSRKAFDQALRIGEVILIKKPGALKKHLSHRGT